MLLIVDQNEQSTNPKTVAALKKHFSNVVIANIDCDVQIPLPDGSVLAIERKAPSDFLASIGDGRLKEQIERMHRIAQYVAIIITGKINYAGNGFVKLDNKEEPEKWKSVSVRGMLRSIQLSGTIIEWCPANFYPQMIEEIYTTCSSEDHRQGLQKHRTITFPPLDDRLQLLGQFSGVGIESATSLLEYAGMMENDADEFGFGTLAAALHWLTILALIDPNSRPKHWTGKRGASKILSNRKLLGLKSNQYLKVETVPTDEELQDQDIEEKEAF